MLSNLMMLFVPLTMAALNTNVNRGSQIVQISTSGATEICVIPKKYPNAKYSDRDVKKEQELCSLGGVEPVALCPKLVSTNPAVEFFSIPDGMTAAEVEAKTCEVNGAKKLAKYKASTSCSYAPSILSYYHISRILGDVLQVPPAVIRTMDLSKHKSIGDKALHKVKAGSLLSQTWSGYMANLKAGSQSSKRDLLMTSDFTQSYAALQLNPRREDRYSEMFFGGKDTSERAVIFGNRSPIYALLKDHRDLRDLVNNNFNLANAQKVLQMEEVSELIIMDTILNQQDRFGNVHFTTKYLYKDPNDAQNIKSESSMSPEDIRARGAVLVKSMMLKDNDCGVTKTNVVKNAKLADGLAHMNPKTYARLMRFNSEISTDAARTFFKEETLMTDADLKSITANLNGLAQMLKKKCQAGTLKLDLDMDAHFANKPLNPSCE